MSQRSSRDAEDQETSAHGEELPSRRKFLIGAGAAAAATLTPGSILKLSTGSAEAASDVAGSTSSEGARRRDESYKLRLDAAAAEKRVAIPAHPANGDEQRYPNRTGNFSKGLPHNSLGEVDSRAYYSLLQAVASGHPSDF